MTERRSCFWDFSPFVGFWQPGMGSFTADNPKRPPRAILTGMYGRRWEPGLNANMLRKTILSCLVWIGSWQHFQSLIGREVLSAAPGSPALRQAGMPLTGADGRDSALRCLRRRAQRQ